MGDVLEPTTSEARVVSALRRASEAMTSANHAIQLAEEELTRIGFVGSKEGERLVDLLLYQRRTHAQLAYHMGRAEGTIRRADTMKRLKGKR